MLALDASPRVLCVAGAAIALWATTASAQEPPGRSCGALYADAREQREAGHAQEARALLLKCARSSCGHLKKTCAREAARIAASVAWIAPAVTDAAGAPLNDVHVSVDGVPVVIQPHSLAFAIDPGEHDVTFRARSFGRDVSKTEKITVAPGQRELLSVRLPWPDESDGELRPAARGLPADAGPHPDAETPAKPPAAAPVEKPPADPAAPPERPSPSESPPQHSPPPSPPRRSDGPPALAFVLGGTGLLGLGVGALATYWGKTDDDALGHCAPNCQAASVDHIRQLYIATDVSFGIGAVALGVSAFLFATSRPTEASPQPRVATSALLGWDVRPAPGGAVATFQGRF
jgi:hypothetical protein